jgi:hypothetical protein
MDWVVFDGATAVKTRRVKAERVIATSFRTVFILEIQARIVAFIRKNLRKNFHSN